MLKTSYQYIYFQKLKQPPERKTSIWSCRSVSRKNELGIIQWLPTWRQYCFFPRRDTIYSDGCLEDIRHFINQLKSNRNKTIQKNRENPFTRTHEKDKSLYPAQKAINSDRV